MVMIENYVAEEMKCTKIILKTWNFDAFEMYTKNSKFT